MVSSMFLWGDIKIRLYATVKTYVMPVLILGSLESHLYWEDYRKILANKAQEGDFIYLDPPYNPMTSTANFTGYTGAGFTKKDQECLAKDF